MNIPDSHLDVYLDGIRQIFNRLNQELDEARNQRDEYKRKCIVLAASELLIGPLCLDTNLAKELQEFRQTAFCQRCKCCRTTVPSSGESCFSMEEKGGHDANLRGIYTSKENETKKYSTISGNAPLYPPSDAMHFARPGDGTYNVEFNHDTKVALELNLVHTLAQNTDTVTYAAFSMDGKYLATVSFAGGRVHVFDVKTGKKLR